ncbi:MAG: hypothetical protein ABIP38_10625 [Steroidobacteraceae bacterium]
MQKLVANATYGQQRDEIGYRGILCERKALPLEERDHLIHRRVRIACEGFEHRRV